MEELDSFFVIFFLLQTLSNIIQHSDSLNKHVNTHVYIYVLIKATYCSFEKVAMFEADSYQRKLNRKVLQIMLI